MTDAQRREYVITEMRSLQERIPVLALEMKTAVERMMELAMVLCPDGGGG